MILIDFQLLEARNKSFFRIGCGNLESWGRGQVSSRFVGGKLPVGDFFEVIQLFCRVIIFELFFFVKSDVECKNFEVTHSPTTPALVVSAKS